MSAPCIAASLTPAAPSAWTATRNPSRWASSAIARNSSSVTCAGWTSSWSTVSAPVAITLMKSAPSVSCSRTAWRKSSAPEASRYIPLNCRLPGDVAERIIPEARIRGPGHRPSPIASLRSKTDLSEALPTSRTVVKPARTSAAAPRARP